MSWGVHLIVNNLKRFRLKEAKFYCAFYIGADLAASRRRVIRVITYKLTTTAFQVQLGPIAIGDTVVTQPVKMDPAVSNDTEGLPCHVPGHIVNVGPGTTDNLSESPDIGHSSSLQSIQTDKRSYLDKHVSDANLKQEPIAIVGMAVNMPGAPNVDRLWEILVNGSNTVEEVRFCTSYLVLHLVDLVQI